MDHVIAHDQEKWRYVSSLVEESSRKSTAYVFVSSAVWRRRKKEKRNHLEPGHGEISGKKSSSEVSRRQRRRVGRHVYSY